MHNHPKIISVTPSYLEHCICMLSTKVMKSHILLTGLHALFSFAILLYFIPVCSYVVI